MEHREEMKQGLEDLFDVMEKRPRLFLQALALFRLVLQLLECDDGSESQNASIEALIQDARDFMTKTRN